MSDAFLADLLILAESLLALVCGAAIGWERETAGKWAGLRTNMLVCFASALFVQVSELVVVRLVPMWAELGVEGDALGVDPIRIVQAIVVGISFVGAGAIFRSNDTDRVRGMTTAATLLAVAPIGIAIGVGHYVLAIGATVLVVFVLRVLERIEPGKPADHEQ